MKAMILAAGRGERMRPLTDTVPKPLLMLAGKPLIVHSILRLKAAGVTDFVINVCHHAEKIKATLQDGSAFGVHIDYSDEEEPLGMAGGLIHALPLLGNQPFIVKSADDVTDYDFSLLVKKAPSVTHAHLVMLEHPPYHIYHLNADGTLALEGEPKLDYAGFSIIHPAILQDLPAGKMELPALLKPHILSNNVTGERFKGEWHNLTTAAQYTELCAQMATSS
ncbi:MAG: NDP-sugar synthase [Gammaproteobacteria bacterium]